MTTTSLSGNDLNLANYLNSDAFLSVVRSVAFLDSGVTHALASISPIRNTLSTFSSQNATLASSQTQIDHMHQKRLERISRKNPIVALNGDSSDEYISGPLQPKNKEPKRPSYTVWSTPFGEYVKLKASEDLPTSHAAFGGVSVGFDYNSQQGSSVGTGGTYVYTNLHENSGAGSAHINQGGLTLYAEIVASNWYFDLSAWGTYYSSSNKRNIKFSGVNEAAHATIHGWQLTPHFEMGYDGFHSDLDTSNWLGVEPFLLADWVADWESSYKETGAEGYNMGQKSRFCSLFRGETGLRLEQVVALGWGKIFFSEKGSYAYQKAFNTGRITAFLVGSSGTFVAEALQGAQNLGVGEISILFSPKCKLIPYFDLRYQGEFGSRYQSHQGMLEIGKSF